MVHITSNFAIGDGREEVSCFSLWVIQPRWCASRLAVHCLHAAETEQPNRKYAYNGNKKEVFWTRAAAINYLHFWLILSINVIDHAFIHFTKCSFAEHPHPKECILDMHIKKDHKKKKEVPPPALPDICVIIRSFVHALGLPNLQSINSHALCATAQCRGK